MPTPCRPLLKEDPTGGRVMAGEHTHVPAQRAPLTELGKNFFYSFFKLNKQGLCSTIS